MKFATVALMGAIGLLDLIEGRRGPRSGPSSAPSYTVTRAICDGFAVEEPADFSRRRLFLLIGDTRISQVSSGDNAGAIRVWSHWYNVDQSDSYSLSIYDDVDCAGTEGATLQN